MVALAFTFLKSNDASVGRLLSVPDTRFLLRTTRPDTLLLRCACRSLVEWGSVRPSGEWMAEMVPSVVLDCVGLPEGDPEKGVLQLMRGYCVAGCCLGLGLRYAGTGNHVVKDFVLRCANCCVCGNPSCSARLTPNLYFQKCTRIFWRRQFCWLENCSGVLHVHLRTGFGCGYGRHRCDETSALKSVPALFLCHSSLLSCSVCGVQCDPTHRRPWGAARPPQPDHHTVACGSRIRPEPFPAHGAR